MKIREFLTCAAILCGGALLTVAMFVVAAPIIHNHNHPATASQVAPPKPPCATETVTVWQDDETPCDVLPGQSLDVAGLTFGNDSPWLICDDMGGDWIGDGVDLCKGVDF